MSLESELIKIKNMISLLDKKIDNLLHERESFAIMNLSEKSLKDFLDREPNLYTLKDVRRRSA
ncbi:MAG: hypothetical protein ACTSUV_01900 [Candidatus Ranarchaeia archaeon]